MNDVARHHRVIVAAGEVDLHIAGGVPRCRRKAQGSFAVAKQAMISLDEFGKAGRRLKTIGAAARAEIAEHLGRPVHLYLHVKVNPRWDEDRGLYREIGLDWAD